MQLPSEWHVIFTHEISPLPWLHNKLCLSQPKHYQSEMVWYCSGVYIINKTLHCHLEIYEISLLVLKTFSLVRYTHSWNTFREILSSMFRQQEDWKYPFAWQSHQLSRVKLFIYPCLIWNFLCFLASSPN